MKYRANKRQPLSEAIKQHAKLHAKYKEYSEKTIPELEEMLPILGGGYKKVCIEVMRKKFIANLKANQTTEELNGEA